MKRVEIISRVENGVIVRNKSVLLNVLKHFNGNDILITVQKKQRQRSNNQNSYYWGVIIELVKNGLHEISGDFYSKEEVHEFLKGKFNIKEIVNEETGEVIEVPYSTIDNSKTEQELFHEKIRRFSDTFLNVKIPLPNEDLKFDYSE